MRLIHTSDWHLGSFYYGYDRMEELFRQVEQVCALASEHKADALLVAGDIFECRTKERAHETTKRLARTLAPYIQDGLHVILMPGNHDDREHFRMMHSLLELEHGECERIHVISDRDDFLFQINGVQFIAVPYPARELLEKHRADLTGAQRNVALNARLAELVRGLTGHLDPDRPALFTTHINVEGVTLTSGKETTYLEDLKLSRNDLPANVSYIALGHIHQAHAIEHVVPCHYSGSFDRMDMGEWKDEKCVLLVDISQTGPATVTSLPLKATPFYDITISSSEIDSLSERYKDCDRAFVRLHIKCVAGDDTVALRCRVNEIFPRCIDLDFPGEHLSRLSTNAPAQPKDYVTTVTDYLSQLYGNDPDLPELERRAQELIQEAHNALTKN
jgi:DNA repair protein SbcD/Mre11